MISIDQIICGNRDAITSIYSSLYPKIEVWIVKSNGQIDQAKEIFHDTLSEIIISPPKKKIENAEAYIFQICKFKYIKLNKSNSTIQNIDAYENISNETTLVDEMIENENKALKYKIYENSYQKLSVLCQQLIHLIKEKNKPAEIAEKLKMTDANTVNRRKFACMESWTNYVKTDAQYNQLYN